MLENSAALVDYITVLLIGDMAYKSCASVGMFLLCGVCGWRSVRFGLGITPESAEYHFRVWQFLADAAGSPELDRALKLNPRNAAAWIARGLESETAGDRKKAEASFLKA